MMVEMGPDRLNHGIWSFIDPNHPRYEPDNPYKESLREYYRFLDGKIGELLDKHADDDTTVLVVSRPRRQGDGRRGLLQRVAAQRGLPRLQRASCPTEITPINKMDDRLVQDQGVGRRRLLRPPVPERRGPRAERASSPQAEYDKVRDELIAKIEAMVDHEGNPMGNKALKPEEIYTTTQRRRSRPHRHLR